ncbi:MAG: DEAD/DEAH box helicase family protein [Gemmatimonadaceae bacterium]|nr:DEAD/DEAH box helicase family protein [Gemmatimonadaceae bacterium]
MNRHVNTVAGRLSLRPPQRRSLEILDRLVEVVPPSKSADLGAALRVIQGEFSSFADFERDFPSYCFALATGVGKTRLMGAFISYLHLAHGIDNFFVLAPNLTIYRKLMADFTPNTPKYVFKGIAEFATSAPEIITGDNYELRAGTLFDETIRCKVNIFNISKITSEVRGGKAPRIKRLSEYIGQSYFDYLAALPNLVLIMDESHRYRASAGVKAINELKPVLGLELTATPYVESSKGTTPFRNVVFDYPLGRAMADGFVKEPAVVTRKDFNPAGMAPEEIERLKLEDGIRLHERVKVELETYAREAGKQVVKPFLLVIARDTTHARHLLETIESDAFFDGRYKGRAIQVDSSRTGAEEEQMIERLLRIEQGDEPTEIVIHVNMLKEGWDVTNLYTIVPLRAANARVLIEQSIGRGLRLPYGMRTGVAAVDRLNIVAHDRFQEIVDEAGRPDSPIRMTSVVLDPAELGTRLQTIVSVPRVMIELGGHGPQAATTLDSGSALSGASGSGVTEAGGGDRGRSASAETHGEPGERRGPVSFATPAERRIAQLVREEIERRANSTEALPQSGYLTRDDVQSEIVRAVETAMAPLQTELAMDNGRPDVRSVVAKAATVFVERTIDIPRILLVPRGNISAGFQPFTLELANLRLQPVSDDLWIQHLRTGVIDRLVVGEGSAEERRAEDYVVSALVDYDDVSYDDQADLLYDLAGQVVTHLRTYLPDDQVSKVLRYHQRQVGQFVHAQMVPQFHEESSEGYDVVVSRGLTPLRQSAFTAVREHIVDYRVAPADRANIGKYLFTGFARCLYPEQKFDSDPERRLAVILERDALKWMKPVRGQFQMHYRSGAGMAEYQPDFVAETEREILMIEVKARRDLEVAEVLLKREVARSWCIHATGFTAAHGGKPWRYLLIPHDEIAENVGLDALVARFTSVAPVVAPA